MSKGHSISENLGTGVMTEVHESMKQLTFLVGHWHGTGTGFCPHGPSFKYEEDVVIENIGQPNFAYSAKSFLDGKTRHLESGFIKCHENTQVLFCIADNLGTCSILLGSLDKSDPGFTQIHLVSDSVTRAPFNREPFVVETVREYQFDGEKLHLTVRMKTNKSPAMSDHLKITYEKAI